MLIDVILVPPAAVSKSPEGQIAVVLDILRASSTIVTALGNQALRVIPVVEPQEAFQLRHKAGDCILGGERKGYKIDGFDLGNSPAEYSEENIAGRTIVLSTTNGTKAALWAKEACKIIIGSFLNMDAVCDHITSRPNDITIVCAGREGNPSLEDMACAGMIVSMIGSTYQLTDAAKAAWYTFEKARQTGLTAFVSQTEHGRYLNEIGMGSDIALCTNLNKFPILPELKDGAITLKLPKSNTQTVYWPLTF